jgi:hypothetical protein
MWPSCREMQGESCCSRYALPRGRPLTFRVRGIDLI